MEQRVLFQCFCQSSVKRVIKIKYMDLFHARMLTLFAELLLREIFIYIVLYSNICFFTISILGRSLHSNVISGNRDIGAYDGTINVYKYAFVHIIIFNKVFLFIKIIIIWSAKLDK